MRQDRVLKSIRLLSPDDAHLAAAHVARNRLTSGVGDTPVNEVFPRLEPIDQKLYSEKICEQWTAPLDRMGWTRAWGAFDQVEGDMRLIGTINLSTTRLLETQRHRVILGLGIELGFRRIGLGSALMREAISWAREQEFIEWIDLGVFANNAPARRLYEKFKFVENGRVKDLFRVDDHKIDDISMTLELRNFKLGNIGSS